MERWISALLRQVERLYDGVFRMFERGTLDFLLRNWIVVVIVLCAACFIIDQALWLLGYKPYKQWVRNLHRFNALLDRFLDWVLKLFGRGGERQALSDDVDAGPDAARTRNALPEPQAEGGTTRISKEAVRKANAAPGDWTERPATYEGVHWWEPKTK